MNPAASRIDALLTRFQGLHPRVIDLSLGRIDRLLSALGRPERRLPPVLHIAGTNGKGSTLAFSRGVLEAAGLRVHAYTSPHLVRFNERISLAGGDIADAALVDLLERVEASNAGALITYFEITTAAALLAFAQAPADVLLLEVGMGGRFDATNVVARPAVSVIAPVDYDHQNFLGDTLTLIAGEKAGILKPRVPAAIARQRPEAMAAIARESEAVGAPLYVQDRAWRVERRGERWRYEGTRWRLDLPAPNLPGEHQYQNAGLALAALEQWRGFDPPPGRLAEGVASARWPARLQRLTRGPLPALLRAGTELWLDGAHNPHGGRALAAWLDRRGAGPVPLIVGMLDSKDPAGFFAALAGRVRALRCVPIPGAHSGIAPQRLAEIARAAGLPAQAADHPAQAVVEFAALAPPPAAIVIAGSLYLAGSILAENS